MGKATILSVVNTIYETAKDGGAYSKFYEQYKDVYLPGLRRAAKSFEEVIAEHEKWIKNPSLKLKNTDDLHYVKRYTEKKWPRDIARNSAYKSIIEGIIEERENGKTK